MNCANTSDSLLYVQRRKEFEERRTTVSLSTENTLKYKDAYNYFCICYRGTYHLFFIVEKGANISRLKTKHSFSLYCLDSTEAFDCKRISIHNNRMDPHATNYILTDIHSSPIFFFFIKLILCTTKIENNSCPLTH